MLRYPCLVLDHDDTTVDSTRSVNYPQFRQALAVSRPGLTMSYEEYVMHCFHLGFYDMCTQVLHYTQQELDDHVAQWERYHETHRPAFFAGMPELICRQKAEGGLVCVVSHSNADVILGAYHHSGVPEPDLILGAEQPPAQRKPHPWPLQEIMRRTGYGPDQLLVVDDMLLGGTMARAAGVAFAGAGWCGMLPEIEQAMRKACDWFFPTVAEFSAFLFDQ